MDRARPEGDQAKTSVPSQAPENEGAAAKTTKSATGPQDDDDDDDD